MSDAFALNPPAAGAGRLERASMQAALVAAVAGAIVLLRLGATTLDDHEAKAALAARAMLRPQEWLVPGSPGEKLPPNTPLNHWLVPQNNGRPRLEKTPLPYWVMAATSLAAGQVTELTVRLQSAVAAVLCSLLVLALARGMMPPRAALLGALMFATSLGLQKWGRSARPEMMLCLFTTAAMGCFYAGLSARSRGRRAAWMLGFWVAMGLANLCKQFLPLLLAVPLVAFVFHDTAARPQVAAQKQVQPRRQLAVYLLATAAAIAAAIVLQVVRWKTDVLPANAGLAVTAVLVCLPLLWYARATGGWRGLGRLLPTAVPGAVIMFAAFLPWMAYMRELFGQASGVFSEQLTERAAGGEKWAVEQPYYYLLPLVTLTLPWVGFIPGALAAAWVEPFSRHRRPLVYLFLWSVGFMGMLTVSAGKREHYILPMLPAICLLMGFVAEDAFFQHRWIRPPLSRRLAMAYAAAAPVGVVVVAGLWAASSLGAGTIAQRIEQAERPSQLLMALRGPGRWLCMLMVTAIAALPSLVALRAARLRLANPFPAVAAGIVVVYLGFHACGPLWDDRVPVADFARRAAGIIGPDARLASWGDPQAKTAFYFGRIIPNALWTMEDQGTAESYEHDRARFHQWLSGPESTKWLFAYGQQLEWLAPKGFEVVCRVQGQQRRKLVFMLLRRRWPPGPVAAAGGQAAKPAAAARP